MSVPHAPQGDAVRTDATRVCREGSCLRTGTPSYESGSFWGSSPPGQRGRTVAHSGVPGSGGEEAAASVLSRSSRLLAGALSTRTATSGEEAVFCLYRVPVAIAQKAGTVGTPRNPTCVSARTRTCSLAFSEAHTYTRVHTHARMCTDAHACTHAHVHTHTGHSTAVHLEREARHT